MLEWLLTHQIVIIYRGCFLPNSFLFCFVVLLFCVDAFVLNLLCFALTLLCFVMFLFCVDVCFEFALL